MAAFAACNSNGSAASPDLAVPPDLAASTGHCQPACTGANVACDPADNQCKPDGTTTNVGTKCDTTGADPKCGSYINATCNDLTNDGFPGGYCSVEPCSTAELCPIGSSCGHLGGESNACWKNCSSDSDCCRNGERCPSPDYACIAIDPLYTSGASRKVCYLRVLACVTSADCPTVKPTCSTPDGGGGRVCM
jgi:hypothetical protein